MIGPESLIYGVLLLEIRLWRLDQGLDCLKSKTTTESRPCVRMYRCTALYGLDCSSMSMYCVRAGNL